MELAEKYIKQVMDEEVLTGKYVKLLVERHLNDLQRKDFPYHFDKEYAEKRVKGIYRWRHSQGKAAGRRFNIQPWQAFIWYMLFGWRTEDNLRRFTKWYLSVARKNGKTEMLATTSNDIFVETASYAPEIYVAATKKDQARKTFQQASIQMKFAQQHSKFLRKNVKIQKYSIVYPSKDGFFVYVSSDADTMDSLNPQVAVVDEYHAHPTSAVLDVFESGMGAREEPLLAITTTAGLGKAVEGPCFHLQQTYQRILEGELHDERVLPTIYTMDAEDFENDEEAWKNPELWMKSNPNLGVSVREDYLKDRCISAQNEGIRKEIDFKTKNLNLWVRQTINGFVTDAKWLRDQKPFDEAILEGKSCYLGLDIGGWSDFHAYTLYFPDVDGDEYVLFRPFVDKETAEDRYKNSPVDMFAWADGGHLTIIEPGEQDDVVRAILEDAKTYYIRGVAYDPYKSKEIIRVLQEEGLKCEPMPQSYKGMAAPTGELFKRFQRGKPIYHNNHPVARWQNGNCMVTIDANENMKVQKNKSADKVDIIVSMIIAYAMYLKVLDERKGTYLEKYEPIKF